MRYLYGDSTESELEFDYLAFIKEVIDCSVVMAECEVTLAVTVEGRRTRELETAAIVAAVEELGKRVAALVGPVAKEQASTPIGRCATTITTAIRDAVDKESSTARAALAVERDEMDKQDARQLGRAKDVLEKLLRTHDLPGAEKELDVTWTAVGVKATMRQRTGFGVDAVLSLDLPAGSIFTLDLRVDRIAEGVEIHAHESGGWLKKSDKRVAHKLGRFHVNGVTIAGDITTVRLRAADTGGGGYVIKSRKNGDLSVEPSGGGPSRDVALDDRDRPGLRLLAERLETAVRALSESRTGLVAVEIDGKAIAQHGHPRVLAERLIAAIAPTVQKIAKHSRSPGELVLRRPIADNRREEIFVSTADLLKRLDGLPSHARELFASLQLGGEPAKAAVAEEPKRPAPTETKPNPLDRKFDTDVETRPDARRPASRTAPPMPEMRSGPRLSPIVTPASAVVVPTAAPAATKPTPSRGEAPPVDTPSFEDKDPPFPAARGDATQPTVKPETKPLAISSETARKRADDSAIGRAIDRALEEEESGPSPK